MSDQLNGTGWRLETFRKSAPIAGTEITVRFNDGTIKGSAGCNTYGGVYKVNGTGISISEIYFTEMACMEPEGVMEQEQMYLGDAYKYQLTKDQQQIFLTAQETLTFVPTD